MSSSSTNKKEDVIMNLLQERHLNYLGLTREDVRKNPFWQNTKSLTKREYQEWLEYGVNSIMSISDCDRTKAEMEMSWIENKYRMKIKN
jgi:hypothetical protein